MLRGCGQRAGISTLKLAQSTAAKTMVYLSGRYLDGKPASLLFGTNGIVTLTFSDVEIAPQ